MPALVIEKIVIHADRIVADVHVEAAHASTTPELAQRVLQARPTLAHHACINNEGPTFADVIEHTPLPHLLEHTVVDILSANSANAGAVFVGTSEWTDRRAGTARVAVSFEDDLAALSAFKEAVEFINNVTAS